jgi:hypothetical protein
VAYFNFGFSDHRQTYRDVQCVCAAFVSPIPAFVVHEIAFLILIFETEKHQQTSTHTSRYVIF